MTTSATLDHDELHLALRNRFRESADVSDDRCAWERIAFKRRADEYYFEEDLVPATNRRITTSSSPTREETGLYVIRVFVPDDAGTSLPRSIADGVLALFSLDWGATLSDGTVLRVRGDVAPVAGQVLPGPTGWAVCPITIPWVALTRDRAAVA
jgi:hypothetical protein